MNSFGVPVATVPNTGIPFSLTVPNDWKNKPFFWCVSTNLQRGVVLTLTSLAI